MAQWRLPTRCLLACLAALPTPAGCTGGPARSVAVRAAAPSPASPVAAEPEPAPVPALPGAPVAADEDAIAALEGRVADLAHEERWDEAFAVVGAEAADVRVQALRAELLRDVGRRHEALALWRRIVAQVGADRVDAATLAAIAGLERMEGERDAAMRTLASLRARGTTDPWVAAHDAELRRLHAELAAGLPIRSVSARDLLGNLRGAPAAEERARALAALLASDAGGAEATAALRARAVLVAVGDADAGVRAAAVAAWRPDGEAVEDFCAHALADDSARVRLAAVPHVRLLDAPRAVALLLRRLAVETDATVFGALHGAMREATGATDVAAPLAGAGPDERDAVVARWRARLAATAQEGRR